jgi:hypothetical protein
MVNDIEQVFTMSLEADSHDLAHSDHEIKGEAQKQPILESGAELRDLGWHKNLANMPRTLITGVTNESLFAMIRRFNKVRTHLAHKWPIFQSLHCCLGCFRRPGCTSGKDDRARSNRGLG